MMGNYIDEAHAVPGITRGLSARAADGIRLTIGLSKIGSIARVHNSVGRVGGNLKILKTCPKTLKIRVSAVRFRTWPPFPIGCASPTNTGDPLSHDRD
jgi:hypothetical protein